MTDYFATIRHHSIARARIVAAGKTLPEAKAIAAREFGDEYLDYEIVISKERDGYAGRWSVAGRRVGGHDWYPLDHEW